MLTLEGLAAGMLSVVAGQLVGSGEAPLATLPRALVRLFTCMCPLVGLQVRGFGVDLLAAVEKALVNATLPIGREGQCCGVVVAVRRGGGGGDGRRGG